VLLRPRANEKHLEYGWNVAPGAPELIETDRTRLGQILTNLLGNAVKFTTYGRVWLDVSAALSPDGRWLLRMLIQDTGPGIPRDALKRVFDPFYQTDLSSSRRHGGTGLGLSISQRLARLMGGDITVESAIGQGSTFTVTVACAEGRVLRAADFLPQRAQKNGRFSGRRVLVVDDDAVNRRLCVLQMSRLGLEVEAVGGGDEAVSRCAEKSFAAVLMDVQMPGMDGFEATRQIRAKDSNRMPIIAFTANVMPDDREKCLAAGMDDYLSKPLQLDDLAAALDRWL
jgi:CheY-like chemotaxis protein